MILINGPACNTTAANISITQACVEFQQDKKPQKNRAAFIKRKSMGTQASMNKEVPDLLLLERKLENVISSVETEVSICELATNLAISDSDSELGMGDDICDVGNEYCQGLLL